jgi:hypothetical protein
MWSAPSDRSAKRPARCRGGQLVRRDRSLPSRHPGVIRRYGGGSEFRFWLPRIASGRNPDLGVVLRGAPKNGRGRQFAALAAEVVSHRRVLMQWRASGSAREKEDSP